MTATDPTPAGLSRRSFLGRSAATGLGVALMGSVDTLFGADPATATGPAVGYGPLCARPRRHPVAAEGLLLHHRRRGRSDHPGGRRGHAVRPGRHRRLRRRRPRRKLLVNNHEISGGGRSPCRTVAGLVYDPGAHGGTTTIDVDAAGRRVAEYVSLAGTYNNCAGGRDALGHLAHLRGDRGRAGHDATKDHGYVFEVDPHDPDANRDPQPIKALGRFAHEAVAVDPDEGRIYLTEDASAPNGLLYRFTPPSAALPLRKGSLRALAPDAGRLEALNAFDGRGRHVPDLSVATRPGTTYGIEWTVVPDRDATAVPTRLQFTVRRSRAAASSRACGGATAAPTSSLLRPHHRRQRRPARRTGLVPRPAHATPHPRRSASPTPRRPGRRPGRPGQHHRVAVRRGHPRRGRRGRAAPARRDCHGGQSFFFARNDLNDSEFTGPNFSPDKKTMFVNIQTPGHVLAIRGPFARQH